MFPYIPNLLDLNLKRNPIFVVKPGDFSSLLKLKKLDLSLCKITKLSPYSFGENQKLETVHLEANLLRHLKVPTSFVSVNQSLTIHDNPWRCDCRLQRLRSWLLLVPMPSEPVCQTPPRLHGSNIRELKYEDFACFPVVSPTYLYLTVKETKDVSFMCRVKSNPSAKITWTFGSALIDNNHQRIKIVHTYEGVLGTRSELYITNSSMFENGTFFCIAENKAGKATSKFVLNVVIHRSSNIVMEVKKD